MSQTVGGYREEPDIAVDRLVVGARYAHGSSEWVRHAQRGNGLGFGLRWSMFRPRSRLGDYDHYWTPLECFSLGTCRPPSEGGVDDDRVAVRSEGRKSKGPATQHKEDHM